jgi:hypothetical protein
MNRRIYLITGLLALTSQQALPLLAQEGRPTSVENRTVASNNSVKIRLGTFSAVPGTGQATEAYITKFEEALKRSFGKLNRNPIELVGGRGDKAELVLSGTIAHVEGANTPFLVSVNLHRIVKGKVTDLVGCWTGYAASVFAFSANPAMHPKGLCGELAETIQRVALIAARQNKIGENLTRLQAGNLKVTLQSGSQVEKGGRELRQDGIIQVKGGPETDTNEVTVRSGSIYSIQGGTRLRLRADAKTETDMMVLGRDKAGQWIPVYLPDAQDGRANGRLDTTVELNTLFETSNEVTLWVVSGIPESFGKKNAPKIGRGEDGAPKSAPIQSGTSAREGQSQPRTVRQPSSLVQVLSGAYLQEQDLDWLLNLVLTELSEPDAAERFQAVKFTLRRADK